MDESCFLFHYVGKLKRVPHLPGEVIPAGCTVGRGQAGGWNVMPQDVLLGSPGSCGHFDMCHLPKCCGQGTPIHGSGILRWQLPLLAG